MRIKLLGSRLLIRPQEIDEKSIVFIPDSVKSGVPVWGRIVRLGTEVEEISLQEGVLVVFEEFSGDEVEIDDVTYLIVEEESILAVYEDAYYNNQDIFEDEFEKLDLAGRMALYSEKKRPLKVRSNDKPITMEVSYHELADGGLCEYCLGDEEVKIRYSAKVGCKNLCVKCGVKYNAKVL